MKKTQGGDLSLPCVALPILSLPRHPLHVHRMSNDGAE